MANYPLMFRIRQNFQGPRVDDVPAEVRKELAGLGLAEKVAEGQSVALAVGSRGIANCRVIVRAMVDFFKQIGGQPFVVPAMGSHGGATAEGQTGVLASYGISDEYLGCPIRSSMDTVVVCKTAEGFDVHFDRQAFEADHVVVFNRVKPHTKFVGDIESGLMKMLLIGLGKREGAVIYHRAILDYSFAQIIRSVVGEVFANCNILAGLAVVENAREETARIEAVLPEDFETREKELLKLARQWMGKLPFKHVDLLLIDRIGKNISGTGLDTNVVGRKYDEKKAVEGEYPKVRVISLRGLTPETHGNAVGMGIAEYCRSRLLEETDFEITRLNAITAGHVSVAMAPLDYATDREIIDIALGTTGLTEPPDAKILWIPNTLELAEMECSAAYLEEARGRHDLEILSDLRELPFDAQGNLPEVTALGE
jgi:hypothetical protein